MQTAVAIKNESPITEQVSTLRNALAIAERPEEVVDLRTMASTLKHHAKLCKDRDAELAATEAHLRATHKLGTLLIEARKLNLFRKGTDAKDEDRVKLSSLGVSKNLSSEAQKFAAIPDFEGMLNKWRDRNIDSTGMIEPFQWTIAAECGSEQAVKVVAPSRPVIEDATFSVVETTADPEEDIEQTPEEATADVAMADADDGWRDPVVDARLSFTCTADRLRHLMGGLQRAGIVIEGLQVRGPDGDYIDCKPNGDNIEDLLEV